MADVLTVTWVVYKNVSGRYITVEVDGPKIQYTKEASIVTSDNPIFPKKTSRNGFL